MSSTYIGYLTSSVTFSQLSDKHERKWFCVIGSVISLYCGLLSVFTENILWFSIMRLFVGIGMGCAINGPCYLGIYQRSKAIAAVNIMSSIGLAYVPLVAYIIMKEFEFHLFLQFNVFLVARIHQVFTQYKSI